MMCTEYTVHVEEELPHATAVPSRLSTKDVVITVVQEETTIDHGALRHPIMIETDSGEIAVVAVNLLNLSNLLSVLLEPE